jgi:hypothetical protein
MTRFSRLTAVGQRRGGVDASAAFYAGGVGHRTSIFASVRAVKALSFSVLPRCGEKQSIAVYLTLTVDGGLITEQDARRAQ